LHYPLHGDQDPTRGWTRAWLASRILPSGVVRKSRRGMRPRPLVCFELFKASMGLPSGIMLGGPRPARMIQEPKILPVQFPVEALSLPRFLSEKPRIHFRENHPQQTPVWIAHHRWMIQAGWQT